jgi:hypothetical protein
MNVLPGIIKGWKDILGYQEGTKNAADGGHFWVGMNPPPEFRILKPFRDPRGEIKYQVRWWNGAVLLLSSMDRAINNGGEFDAIAFEEVKFMKRQPVKEILLAKRGNKEKFQHLYQYGSVLMVTDRPEVHDPGRWVLDEATKVTKETNELILKLCFKLAQINHQISEAEAAKKGATADKLYTLMARYNRMLNELRKNSFNYIEVSTLENIHALGVKTLVDYYNSLDPYEYTVSVLNEDPGFVPNSFYAKLDRDKHGYRMINYNYIDNLDAAHRSEIKRNMNWDNDVDHDEILCIGMDHNAAINNIVTAQRIGNKAYLQTDLYVESPEYLKELMTLWMEYYRDHRTKTVKYYYNQTSVSDDSRGNPAESETVINILRQNGWTVIPEYQGGTPDHEVTQKLWSLSLSGDDPRLLEVRINLQAAGRLFDVMKKTGVLKRGKKYKKDKRSEIFDYKAGKYNVPQPQATHVTEAADVLLLGMQRDYHNGDLSPVIGSFGSL